MTMYQQGQSTKSAPTTETSDEHLQVARPQAPEPEERFTYSFKSLFTLADVAAKRRASGSFKKWANNTDENAAVGGDAVAISPLKRSKSSGDIAVLGDKTRRVISALVADRTAGRAKPSRGSRHRAATTPAATPSKIPKAKSTEWFQSHNTSPEENSLSSSISTASSDLSDPDALSVDDAVFVMVTPPSKKYLTLAAHTPSLPRIASPFSPRMNHSRECTPQPLRVRPTSARSCPGTGHTNASLHLTKSHWELRYETWVRSLHNNQHAPVTENSPELSFQRSRFPEPLENPALFPRAGSLTPTALRPILDGSVTGEDARPALEVDWAMRAWPLDKIQRTLFVHDMDVRTWFPIGEDLNAEKSDEKDEERDKMSRVATSQAGEEGEREHEHSLRKWEWDWELRWRVIEGMVEDEADREHSEYDVFLAEADEGGDCAYGGCDVQEKQGTAIMVEGDWGWSEDAMEVDAIL